MSKIQRPVVPMYHDTESNSLKLGVSVSMMKVPERCKKCEHHSYYHQVGKDFNMADYNLCLKTYKHFTGYESEDFFTDCERKEKENETYSN